MPRKRTRPRAKLPDSAQRQSDLPSIVPAELTSAKIDVDTTRVGGRRRREILLQRQPIPEEILTDQAKNTKYLNAHFRKIAPNDAQWLSKAASMIWIDAVGTVYALYEASEENSTSSKFRLDLTHLVSVEARNSLLSMARHHPIAKTKGVVREAYMTLYDEACNAGPEIVKASGKAIIHEIRESLRDFGDISRAIALNEEFIAGMAEAGNDTFFADLGEVVKDWRRYPAKYKRHTTTRIIFRAWLPLRLWECAPDGMDAEARCRWAAGMLRWEIHSFTKFLNAWRTFRSRVVGRACQLNYSRNLPRQ